MRKYYRNGQLKDSLWLKISGGDEIIFGTEKSYYENGHLASITYHGKNWNEYTTYEYFKNGRMERVVKNPAGPTDIYRKNGKQKRHYEAYVPKQYKKQRHLIGTSFAVRIMAKKAFITMERKKRRIKAGALVSLYVRGDTNRINHCQVEGFSKDSLYISKFESSPNGKGNLNYIGTVALGFNQVKSIYYSKNNKFRRGLASLSSTAAGFAVIVFSAIYLPSAIKANVEGEISGGQIANFYATTTAIGVPLILFGNYLSRTMVPKKYDMNLWKIEVKY